MLACNLRKAPMVLLDNSGTSDHEGISYLFQNPEKIICARSLDEIPAALEAMDTALAGGMHLAGWVAYEVAAAFEGRIAAITDTFSNEPLIWMMVCKNRQTLNTSELETHLFNARGGNAKHVDLTFDHPQETKDSYTQKIDRVKDYINAGDVYQINYTFAQNFDLRGDPLTLYNKLRASQPVEFGAFIDTGDEKILSRSPELFVARNGNALIAKPMKGTAPRGRTTSEDEQIANQLAADEKSQAENLMIVDLIRNDLSRIAKPGSVKTPALFSIEKYKSLFQMTSTVRAEGRDDLTPSGLLKALFPCGSVTGAPKIRAMEIIRELEERPRGVYCGAIGYFSPASKDTPAQWALNVPIRTIVLEEQSSNTFKGRLNIGSGIVADSQAGEEYKECLLKGKFARVFDDKPAHSLIETIKLGKDGAYVNLNDHLNRMRDSAVYFDFPFERTAIEKALIDHASVRSKDTDHRVRLLSDATGSFSITSEPFITNSGQDTPLKVCFAETPVSSGDIFLFHKTTNRALYNRYLKSAMDQGLADVIFMNENNHITEGAISNIIIEKNGQWMTPPIEDGLLAGIGRKKLLNTAENKVVERHLTKADVVGADAVYLINSLRGLRRVQVIDQTI